MPQPRWARARSANAITSPGRNTSTKTWPPSGSVCSISLGVPYGEAVLHGEAMALMLRQGDVVFVPKNGFGNWNDAINEILPSLQAVSALLQPFVQIEYLKHY